MKFIPLLAGRDFQNGIQIGTSVIQQMPVDDDILNHDQRRLLVHFGIGRINNDEALAGGKTNPSVSQFARGRLHAAGTFDRWQAVAFAVGERGDGFGFSISETVERFFGNARDTVVRADPEISISVLFNGTDEIIGKAGGSGNPGKFSILKT